MDSHRHILDEDQARQDDHYPITIDHFQHPTMLFIRLARSPPVLVTLGEGGNRIGFNIPRNILIDFLPWTERPIRRRGTLNLDIFFRPNVIEQSPASLLRRAIFFVFQQLQEYSSTGRMDMFASAEQRIERISSRRRAAAAKDWGALMDTVCMVLGNDTGLGCSSFFLHFVLQVMDQVFRLLNKIQTKVLFRAISRIFVPSREGLARLHGIWNRFDRGVQKELLDEMRLVLREEGPGSSIRQMYRALRRNG